MVICYVGYTILMVFNGSIERWSHKTKSRIRTKVFPNIPNESTPLHTANKAVQVRWENPHEAQSCTTS